MLPFDTLLMPVSLQTRLIIAYGASMHISASTFTRPHHNQQPPQQVKAEGGMNKLLRIGFMSYDFNDHPTAHLLEGIFDVVYRRNQRHQFVPHKYTLIIFSYGKNDGSTYRLQLEQVSMIYVE